MTYQVVLECNTYCGTSSETRCRAIQEYLKHKLVNIDSVQMIENEVLQNLIRPQIFIRCNEENHPDVLLRTLDEKLLEIGLYAIKALVIRIVTHAIEGIAVGGSLGALLGSKKQQKTLAVLISALIGGAVGDMIKTGTLELVANKAHSGWIIERFVP